MCTLLFVSGPAGPGTMALLANRDESRRRAFAPPAPLRVGRRVALCPRDHLGGTWLGLNEGLLVAVTNAPATPSETARRSRGLLVRDVLAAGSAGEAEQLARDELSRRPYDGFNLLLADAHEAIVLSAADGITERARLRAGAAHLLHDRCVGAGQELELDHALGGIGSAPDWHHDPEAMLRAAGTRFLSAHEPLPWTGRPACRHGEERGTVSSALVYLDAARPRSRRFLFGSGLPCDSSWQDVDMRGIAIATP